MSETELQASTDTLTGLLNRRSLETKVQALRRDAATFVVAVADLDRFKELNDVHGHETGDRALRLFAQTLRSSLRDQDIVSRHGGEEFAVVLPGCTIADASLALDTLRHHLLDAIRGAGLPTFTVSLGIVEAVDTEDLATMLARADAALLHAKRAGRDRIVIHDRHGAPIPFETPPSQSKGGREQRPTTPPRPNDALDPPSLEPRQPVDVAPTSVTGCIATAGGLERRGDVETGVGERRDLLGDLRLRRVRLVNRDRIQLPSPHSPEG